MKERSMLANIGVLLGIVAVFYLAGCAWLYTQQDSLLFYPQPNDPALVQAFRGTRVHIPSAEGAIEAWWASNPGAASDATVLYFGGNAEDVLYFATTIGSLGVQRLLVSNYRGYGETPGRMSESAAYADGLAVYDYAVKQPGVDARKVIVMGRSLGSGIATYVARHRPVARVLLITPYDSIAAVARAQYSFAPVSLLLKSRFPSDELAPAVKAPVLMLAAARDQVIPPAHAQRLFDVWAGPKRIEVLDNVGHNDIDVHPRYRTLVSAFLMN